MCGNCRDNAHCQDGLCACDVGFVPNRSGDCVRVGGPCVDVLEVGHCVGDYWVFCAGQLGVQYMGCQANGFPGCVGDQQDAGACACGPVDRNGLCSNNRQFHFRCNEILGVMTQDHCPSVTRSANGFCSTLVTAFGSQTTCFCDRCQTVDPLSGRCEQACLNCQLLDGNVHACP